MRDKSPLFEMINNVSREHLCLELRRQSRRGTLTDVRLVTEEGAEVAAHKAVLSSHSELLRSLLQRNRGQEEATLVLCGVSKPGLDAFLSLLYCGEVRLSRPETESLTDLLTRLDVDTKHLSLPGFLIQSQTNSQETRASQAVKVETDSIGDIDIIDNDTLDNDEYANDFGTEEDLEKVKEDCRTEAPLVEEIGEKNKQEGPDLIMSTIPIIKKKKPPQKAPRGHFMCPECGVVLTMKRTLTKHILNKHRGVRFPCDQCPYQGRDRMQLKLHIESVHEGKRYYCDQCEYIALTKNYLQAHINYTHCEKNFGCDHCNYKAKTAISLKTHVDAVHLKIKLSCPECGSKHSQKAGLLKHMKLKHGHKPREYISKKKISMLSS